MDSRYKQRAGKMACLRDNWKKYRRDRANICAQALKENGFEAFYSENPGKARRVAIDAILPRIKSSCVTRRDPLTRYDTGILDVIKKDRGVGVIEPFETAVPLAEII